MIHLRAVHECNFSANHQMHTCCTSMPNHHAIFQGWYQVWCPKFVIHSRVFPSCHISSGTRKACCLIPSNVNLLPSCWQKVWCLNCKWHPSVLPSRRRGKTTSLRFSHLAFSKTTSLCLCLSGHFCKTTSLCNELAHMHCAHMLFFLLDTKMWCLYIYLQC